MAKRIKRKEILKVKDWLKKNNSPEKHISLTGLTGISKKDFSFFESSSKVKLCYLDFKYTSNE